MNVYRWVSWHEEIDTKIDLSKFNAFAVGIAMVSIDFGGGIRLKNLNKLFAITIEQIECNNFSIEPL